MATRSVSTSRFVGIGASEKGLSFNGTSDLLTCPVVPLATGFNLGFWIFKVDQASTSQKYFDSTNPQDRNGFCVQTDNGNNFYIYFCNASGVTFGATLSKLPVGSWRHFVFTFDGTTSKGYLDSVLFATSGAQSMTNSAGTFTIARKSAAGGNWAKAIYKDIVFQNTATAWTQAQINALYYQRAIPSGANVWYKFDNNVNDSSGNGNTGTLTGGSYVTNVPSQFTKRSTAGTRTATSARSHV